MDGIEVFNISLDDAFAADTIKDTIHKDKAKNCGTKCGFCLPVALQTNTKQVNLKVNNATLKQLR